MPRKSSITVTSRADAQKTATVAALRDNPVLARRLASGNLNGSGSLAIPLKEPERWYTRIDNQLADPNMFYRLVHEMGYEPLKPADLACSPTQAGFRVSEDGNLVRGPAGQEEMVFKMPTEQRALLDQAVSQANLKGIGSASKIKSDIAEAASQLGEEAADYVHSLSGSVIDSIGS